MNDIQNQLAKLALTLPPVAPVAGSYVPVTEAGNLLFVSGQLPMREGKIIYSGKVGHDITIEDGIQAAEICALNILAQVNHYMQTHHKNNPISIVKLGGFVNCNDSFTEHPKIINGASDLMLSVFGDAGKHARFAVGAPSLPLNAAVEVEAIVALG